MEMKIATCTAPVNIAVIKYWGKRDEDLILPLNDSISSTLCMTNMCAQTTVMISPDIEESKFWLNGEEQSLENPRLLNCLKEIKARSTLNPEALKWKIRVNSKNNFPTAAGLASSAAGYACLVTALAHVYGYKGDLSEIARRGSGSACRSVYGGWVRWFKGVKADGSDSIAKQIAPASHWPEMRVVVLVVNDQRKMYSSTTAMKSSTETSEFLNYRKEHIVPKRAEEMQNAILNKDFELFAKLTMMDSNSFHAVCQDTYPPCPYMSPVSHAVVNLVHKYNEYCGEVKVAYTFDAGPNACLYMLQPTVSDFLSLVFDVFNINPSSEEFCKGEPLPTTIKTGIHPLNDKFKCEEAQSSLKYIISTKVGEGPKILSNPFDHLLDDAGNPK